MKLITNLLKILFQDQLPQNLLRHHKYYASNFPDNITQHLYYQHHNYTNDESDQIYQKLTCSCEQEEDTSLPQLFQLLLDFTKRILIEHNREPEIIFRHLLKWREASHLLGEDIFTTLFLANRDQLAFNKRFFFTWRPVLGTDYFALKEMLKQGMAENHFHLKGSAPHFSISWLNIMNNPANHNKAFKKLNKKGKLRPDISFSLNQEKVESLYCTVKKAALIRLFLISKILEYKLSIKTQYLRLLNAGELEFSISLSEITRSIKQLGYINSWKYHGKHFDYAIPKSTPPINQNSNIFLSGERWFLYEMYRKMLQNDEEFLKYQDHFYYYLVVKTKLRSELIQVNEQSGFDNFSSYQDRKEIFIPDDSIYQQALYKMAVDASRENQKIDSFEMRITPKNNRFKLRKAVNGINNAIQTDFFKEEIEYTPKKIPDCFKKQNRKPDDPFYVVHFIKSKDTFPQKKSEYILYTLKPRHNKLRKRMKKQARAIAMYRQYNGNRPNYILGIDAASAEIGCRPEVFAQSYRFLRTHCNRVHSLLNEQLMTTTPLGITYHAGEDFLDIVDGLRAIDETIKFLGYQEGDRLGHALALGADPEQYYKQRNYRIFLPRQDFLDNIVWFMVQIRRFGIQHNGLMQNLNRLYDRYFNDIYPQEKEDHDHYTYNDYYDAWKLRGDDPACYQSGEFKSPSLPTYWNLCGVNEYYPRERGNNAKDLRIRNKKAAKLYYRYHFDPKAKQRGTKVVEHKVDHHYIQAVKALQLEIRRMIAKKRIAIETNPSSNYMIGSFERYDDHPIVQFYNEGLTYDPKILENTPQLFVSINTDDQGVFNTYLENEYALLAIALSKMKKPDGTPKYQETMILHWLDRIRRMGLNMSFKNREKL